MAQCVPLGVPRSQRAGSVSNTVCRAPVPAPAVPSAELSPGVGSRLVLENGGMFGSFPGGRGDVGQGCTRRPRTSAEAQAGVRQAVGGGCRSGWGRLLSVTNAIEAGAWRSWGQWLGVGLAPGAPPPPLFCSCIPRVTACLRRFRCSACRHTHAGVRSPAPPPLASPRQGTAGTAFCGVLPHPLRRGAPPPSTAPQVSDRGTVTATAFLMDASSVSAHGLSSLDFGYMAVAASSLVRLVDGSTATLAALALSAGSFFDLDDPLSSLVLAAPPLGSPSALDGGSGLRGRGVAQFRRGAVLATSARLATVTALGPGAGPVTARAARSGVAARVTSLDSLASYMYACASAVSAGGLTIGSGSALVADTSCEYGTVAGGGRVCATTGASGGVTVESGGALILGNVSNASSLPFNVNGTLTLGSGASLEVWVTDASTGGTAAVLRWADTSRGCSEVTAVTFANCGSCNYSTGVSGAACVLTVVFPDVTTPTRYTTAYPATCGSFDTAWFLRVCEQYVPGSSAYIADLQLLCGSTVYSYLCSGPRSVVGASNG